MITRGDALRLPFPDRTFDLVVGSPPYLDARLYLENGSDLAIARDCRAWVAWMVDVTAEALRVSRGLVLWVCAGKTDERNYQPGPEGLLWRWWERGGDCHCLRPVYWHRVGIPGSGGDQWFRGDIEYVLAFKRPGRLPYAENTANGQAPKWAPGGEMSYRGKAGTRRNHPWGITRGTPGRRNAKGERDTSISSARREWEATRGDETPMFSDDEKRASGKRNQWGASSTAGGSRRKNGERQPTGRPSHRFEAAPHQPPAVANLDPLLGKITTKRDPNGVMREQAYYPPVVANPGNLLHTTTGGGQLGSGLAHENEAPYPEEVPGWFIASHSPPEGLILDPFSGSGTTAAAALAIGRRAVSLDLRASQCQLTRRRLRGVTPGFVFQD